MTSKRKPSKKATTTKATGKVPRAGQAAVRAQRPAAAAPAGGSSAKGTTSPTAAPSPKAGRSGTKHATLITMLRTGNGATIDEVAKALGWQRHTVRGAIAGALKKKLGLNVTSEKIEDRGRVYRIAG